MFIFDNFDSQIFENKTLSIQEIMFVIATIADLTYDNKSGT
jgi:hypothetical protein